MWKTTYREIRQSFGRYAAILAIVALGVGFFVGLMVVTPAMVRNGGRYLNNHDLYDLRRLSTLGFEKDSVDAFTGREDVKAVEGAVSSDFLAVDESGKSRVLVAQTLLEVQNQVELKAGRLPEAADEIVMDSSLFSKDDIGKTIQVSDENPEETADLFAYDVYTIVGIADASYYINYQRGATTLGTGRVSGFVYMLPDGFDTNYYTEIFVRLDQNDRIYSDVYKKKIEDLKTWAEPIAEQEAQNRYDSLKADAQQKVDDAQKELRDQTADARTDLEEAKQKLTDGQKELADGKEQIADARKQLKQAKQTLAQKQTELNNGRAQLVDGRSQLEAGQVQLDSARAQLNAAIAAAQSAGSQAGAESGMSDSAAASPAQLWQQLAQLDAQQAALDAQRNQLESSEAELTAGEKQLAAAKQELSSQEKQLNWCRRLSKKECWRMEPWSHCHSCRPAIRKNADCRIFQRNR